MDGETDAVWPRWSRYPVARWLALLVLSAVLSVALTDLRLSAARLLGPLIAAIVFAIARGTLTIPARPFMLAQAIIGCMIACTMPVSIASEILHSWPIFLSTVLSVVLASVALGWILTRWNVLPGTTAVWGSFPGGASVMALMAEAFGADGRLVAFMQYTRVLLVAVVATLVTRLWVPASPAHPAFGGDWTPVAWVPFLETLLLAAGGAWLGGRLRVPAGALLVPMFAGVFLEDSGWLHIELPLPLLTFAYAMVGWAIGLRFDREILQYVARSLPRVIGSTLMLIALCGLLAALLVKVAHVDPLTAYLATSPGGADSVAIIASTSKVDVPFVMAMQTARFLFVILAGPALARFVAVRARPSPQARQTS